MLLLGVIDTYLVCRLTNGAVFATDHTNASRTMLFDLAALNGDDELCLGAHGENGFAGCAGQALKKLFGFLPASPHVSPVLGAPE